MKIVQSTIDLPEEVWKAFATKYCSWTEKVMTTDQSPNVEIDNPITWQTAIQTKYHTPILTDIADFNLEQIKADVLSKLQVVNQEFEQAKAVALQQAGQVITFLVQ